MRRPTSHLSSNVEVLVKAFLDRRVSASFLPATRILSEVSVDVWMTFINNDCTRKHGKAYDREHSLVPVGRGVKHWCERRGVAEHLALSSDGCGT